jgi:broad specificity phosphatase PhoE
MALEIPSSYVQAGQITARQAPQGWHVVDPQEGSIAPDDGADRADLGRELHDNGIRLIAVRHGQSETNAFAEKKGVPVLCGQVESPLSSKGMAQACEAADKIYQSLGGDAWLMQAAGNPALIPVIYSSTLSRALNTAHTTADLIGKRAGELADSGRIDRQAAERISHDVQPHQDKRILEMSYGDFELQPIPSVIKEQPEFMGNWEAYKGKGIDFVHSFPNGESRSDVIDRVSSFMRDLVDHDGGRTVLMFCHAETIVAAQTILGKQQLDNGRIHVNVSGVKNATPIELT